MKINSCCPN